jgi:hypothetical protein
MFFRNPRALWAWRITVIPSVSVALRSPFHQSQAWCLVSFFSSGFSSREAHPTSLSPSLLGDVFETSCPSFCFSLSHR